MSARRGKLVFAIGAVLFGAVTFMLASSYLIERAQPKWLAAAVGALAFPVLPVLWQVIGERRRTRRIAEAKTPPKNPLSPGDRYVMRAIACAALVIGPQLVIGKLDVARAAWNHKTWFVPETPNPYLDTDGHAGNSALLTLVPADAELVAVVRSDDDDAKLKQQNKPGIGVFAYGDRQLLVVAPKTPLPEGESVDDMVRELNANREKVPFVKIDPVAAVDGPSGLTMLASERWRGKVGAPGMGPSGELRTELDRAPANANAVVAYVPKTPLKELPIKRASAWLVANQSDKKLVVDARVEATDVKAAETLIADARKLWDAKRSEVPSKCRDQVDAIAADVKFERTGLVITFHLELDGEKLMGLMFCGMQAAE